MKHITDKEYCELGMKTALQWAKEKMVPNKDSGIMLWCNPYHNRYAIYYRSDEVHKASEEELDVLLRPIRENRKKSRERRKQREKEAYKEALEDAYKRGKRETREEYERAIAQMQSNYKKTIYSLAAQKEPVACTNETGKIVFDVETTGLNAETDEILQISIIDGDGNVLINSYVKPYYMENWSDTEPIHGITKEMVKNAPYPHELIPMVKGIFDNTAEWIGYNGVFDLNFLKWWGIERKSDTKLIDVMEDFSPLYGEWSDYYSDYKWQSLEKCARYFEYEFKAHDSLEDVKATLHCYNSIERMIADGSYQEIVSSNEKLNIERY